MKRLLIAGLALAAGCAEPALVEYDARMQQLVELEETDVTMRPPVEVVVPVEVAEVASTAQRVAPPIQVTPTEPPPDPVDIVNGLPYRFYDPEPAKTAWYVVTGVRGWSSETQDRWWPWTKSVMMGESGFCWNRLRGDVMAFPNDGCVQERQGTHEDAGFFQVTAVHYGSGNWLCVEYQICSRWEVIQDPWTSMLAGVLLQERFGKQPWCFSDFARRYHDCHLAPDGKPGP